MLLIFLLVLLLGCQYSQVFSSVISQRGIKMWNGDAAAQSDSNDDEVSRCDAPVSGDCGS